MKDFSAEFNPDFCHELESELERILSYWMQNTPDNLHEGFVGRIDENNIIDYKAPKGSVLNARILWTFSAAFNHFKNAVFLDYAGRAYQYIIKYFIDKKYGGVFWTVDSSGNPADTKKQIYALAFTIYGLSEYYKATQFSEALKLATELYRLIERYSFAQEKGGYFEAFTREWKEAEDMRLSAKDANERKTMNTHLHILEAYSNLYQVWPDEILKKKLAGLIALFFDHIIDPETKHLALFFDDKWNRRSDTISYGHDIEASWLILEAAETIGDKLLIEKARKVAVEMAEAALTSFDEDGGMWYEFEPGTNHLVKEKHWWVQAEALVGFVNAARLSNDPVFYRKACDVWRYIQNDIIDTRNGEWHWGIKADGLPMADEDKVGIWKCPYHSSRACMEVIRRLKCN